jgi:uncharacterized membrane protein (UPF0127 family)
VKKKQVRYLVGIGVFLLVVAASFLFFFKQGKPQAPTDGVKVTLSPKTDTEKTFTLEVVKDGAAQVKGLSGRSGLGADQGMLFDYGSNDGHDHGTDENHCIWMKEMNFSIDVVWVDSTERITSIVPDLSPDTYPQAYCAKAEKILELPAGTAARHGLRVGQKIDL